MGSEEVSVSGRRPCRSRTWVEEPSPAPDYGKERVLFSDMEKALENLESIIAGQKEMIAERDRRISELQAIANGRLPYRLYNYLKKAGRKIRK